VLHARNLRHTLSEMQQQRQKSVLVPITFLC